MVTRILKIDENNADEVIAQAGEVLKNGGLVASPPNPIRTYGTR